MGVREIDRFLQQWQMGIRDLRRRTVLAPTPRERERWQAIWLLARGGTASAMAEAPERDPHAIGRWASPSERAGPQPWSSSRPEVPPRPRRDAAGEVEGGGAGVARHGGHWPGQLDPSASSGGSWYGSSSAVSLGTMRRQPVPQQLSELPPSTRGQALHRL